MFCKCEREFFVIYLLRNFLVVCKIFVIKKKKTDQIKKHFRRSIDGWMDEITTNKKDREREDADKDVKKKQ